MCTFPGCDNPVESKGHCVGHATQRRRGKELTPLRPKRTDTHCARGHDISVVGTYQDRGYPRCKACVRSPERQAQAREYAKNHKAQAAERQRRYREKNADRLRELRAGWTNDPAKANARSAARRARKRNATKVETFSAVDVVELYGVECHLCGDPIDMDAPRRAGSGEGWEHGLHIDHVVSLLNGGTHTLENCRPSHAICNLKKGSV